MKKLIPALALLLISSVLLSVASYAWFSMNTTVSAKDMKVNAVATKNLVISDNNSSWDQIASATNNAQKELFPVSTVSLANWFALNDTGMKKINYRTGASNEGFEPADFDKIEPDGNSHYLLNKFYIRVVDGDESASYSNLYVSGINVERAVGESDVSKSLRVGVKVGETTYIFAPLRDGDTAVYNAISSIDTTVDTTEVTPAITGSSNAPLGEVSTTAVEVYIYVWYEGQDENNTSKNAETLENLVISVDFSADNNT